MSNFPTFQSLGNPVDARKLIEPGTGLAYFWGSIVFVILGLVFTIASYGIFLIILLLAPIFSWFQHKRALARIHGSGLKVSDNQFPEIYDVVKNYANRLKINVPEVYIVESNMINAFAIKYGATNVVLLTDDIIQACFRANQPSALCYVIGHELGHIALKHNNTFRKYVTSRFHKLSRLDEYSADSVAFSLVNDKKHALAGLIILTIGPDLIKYINFSALSAQIKEVSANKYTAKSEKQLTHPLLLNRIKKLNLL